MTAPHSLRSLPTPTSSDHRKGPLRPMPIPDSIAAFIDAQAKSAPVSYDDLRVVIFNGTTKRSPEPSHTDGLLAIPCGLFSTLGARYDEVRTVDRTIPPALLPHLPPHADTAGPFPAHSPS